MAEIAGQPDALRRAARSLLAHTDELGRIAGASEGRTVVLTGMGASYDACYPIATELARAGRIALMVDAAELLHFRSRMIGPDTLVVAVSQSGSSAETVRLAEKLGRRPDRPVVAAITNGRENALARLASLVVDTGVGEETGPSSMTFVASLVVLAGIGRAVAGGEPRTVAERLEVEAGEAADAVERLLATESLGDELVAWADGRETIVLLGRGPARAAAEMGALTLKEAVGAQAESLETAQFRHGPLELVGPGLAAILVATERETLDLDFGLAAELLDARAAVLLVTRDADAPSGAVGIRIGEVDRLLAPAVSLVPVQLLARRLALRGGREPGGYLRASKVTTRE